MPFFPAFPEHVVKGDIFQWDGVDLVRIAKGSADQVPVYGSDGMLNMLTVVAGVYTPTLSNVANLDASTAFECQYLRVGASVVVSGKVDVDPTLTATSTQLGITIPVASNFGTAQDLGGAAAALAIAGMSAAIFADTTNDRAQMQFISTDINNNSMYFTFMYQIL